MTHKAIARVFQSAPLIAVIAAALAAAYVCRILSDREDAARHDAIAFAHAHASEIADAAARHDYRKLTDIKQMRVTERPEKGVVDFLCEGIGLGPDGKYFGFYWSNHDTPENIVYAGPLTARGSGFCWESENSSVCYYTERIEPHIFCYEYSS